MRIRITDYLSGQTFHQQFYQTFSLSIFLVNIDFIKYLQVSESAECCKISSQLTYA